MAKDSVKNVKIFLSATTREFGDHRQDLASRVTRDNVEVKTQEELYVLGYTTLVKLDHYIAGCNAVVHLLGDSTGATPEIGEVKDLLEVHPDLPAKLPELAPLLSLPDPGISYTQWEAYLAIYHKRRLLIYRPTDDAPRTAGHELDAVEQAAQLEHYERICAMGRDRGQFHDVKDLSANVLRDLVDVLAERDAASSWIAATCGKFLANACGSLQKTLHALHCSTMPRRREFRKSAGDFPMFWAWVMYRFFAVSIAVRVIWEFCFQLEDGSLYGLQQSAFLYAAAAGNFLLIGWQQLELRFRQVVRLFRGGNWRGRKHELAAKGVDLCLMPLEITCVFAALPVAAEKILRRATQEGHLTALILLGAGTLGLALLHAGRHWPIYHHFLRRLRIGDFPAWALTLNWAVGIWFLFNPQLLPSGAIAEYHTQFGRVTHLAADSSSTEPINAAAPQELVAASVWDPRDSAKGVPQTTLELLRIPGFTRINEQLEGVPWGNLHLQQLTFHNGLISALRMDFSVTHAPEEFRVWQRGETWQVVKKLPDDSAYYIHSIVLDRTGRLMVYGSKRPPPGEEGPTAAEMIEAAARGEKLPQLGPSSPVETVFGYSEPPGNPYVMVGHGWANQLVGTGEFTFSPDATLLAVVVNLPEPPPSPRKDGKEPPPPGPAIGTGPYDLLLVDVATGETRWQVKVEERQFNSPSFSLTFSPDGKRLLLSRRTLTEHHIIDISDVEHRREIVTDSGTPLWSPNNRLIAIRTDHELLIYSSQNAALLESFRVPRGKYLSHTFTRDSRYVAAGGDSGTVWLYQLNH